MNDMFIIGHFMRFCSRVGVYGRFGPLLRAWIASDSTADFTFSQYGHFRHFRKLTDEQERDFADAKYRRWRNIGTQDFFRATEQFSVFATVSEPITQFLFENRRDKSVSFSQWMGELRSSEMLKHVLADIKTLNRLRNKANGPSCYPEFPDLDRVIDLGRAKFVFEKLDVSKGQLLVTIHDAHLILAKRCLAACVPERHSLGLHGGRNRIGVGKDGNAHVSAFQAVKVLRARKMLLMVPDARREVQQNSQVRILGKLRPFADGAPTIAYESDCATGWYTIARSGDGFVPVYEPGPRREPGEPFKGFKERWWAFYSAQVEQLFTGDPRNITLWHFWPKLFAGVAPDGTDDSEMYESEFD